MPTKSELMKKWKERPLSWSQIGSFEYDPEQWYQSYILGKKASSPEMTFGSQVGKKLETDPTFLPSIPREKKMEYEFTATYKRKKLTGFADSFCDENLRLREYKTGVKAWDQKRVDEHGQITFYCLMKYLKDKTKPEDILCTLHWMPTVRKEKGDFTVVIEFVKDIEKNIKHFETRRTMKDIVKMCARIDDNLKKMEAYALNHE